jgi:hypothetical protein
MLQWASWLPGNGASLDRSTHALAGAISGLPRGVRASVQVVERHPGSHAAEIIGDAARPDRALTIPVTLPSLQSDLAPSRQTGQVYLAGHADLDVFTLLRRVFPGLRGWSAQRLPLEGAATRQGGASMQAVSSHEYRRHLAASTLALDLGNVDPNLPVLAVAAGVPCVALRTNTHAAALWPALAVAAPVDPPAVFANVRRVLTDQAENETLCAFARERLASRTQEVA